MRTTTLLTAALAASIASAHTIMQKISVNGVDQGQLKGVRAPSDDSPIQNVNDGSFACNKNLQYKDNTIITVPAGAKVGGWWGHVIGGAQFAGDPDQPIAPSHKGPIMYYLAKVDNAATTGTTGLQWFKVAHEGNNGGKWAVDTMIQNGGWHYFTMPSCVAPGDYLLRVELLALHSASKAGEAQFYMECAQIRVTGSGNSDGGSKVSFPGAYSSNDPGVLISIYDSTGQPTNGGRPYVIPGPPVMSCGSGSGPNPTTTGGGASPTTTIANGSGGGSVPLYGQCGGSGYSGPTSCSSGSCKVSNQWYSQCLP